MIAGRAVTWREDRSLRAGLPGWYQGWYIRRRTLHAGFSIQHDVFGNLLANFCLKDELQRKLNLA
jgi:hypothetical protein